MKRARRAKEFKLSLADGRLNSRPPLNMKPVDPIEKNDPLGRTLEEWKVDASLPPRFRDAVWRRIALTEVRREASGWRDWFQAVEAAFRRPALAASFVAILLLAGLSIGFIQARQESARADAALGARYVQSIDPYQAPRH
jgi:hypothetical protein